MPIVLGEIEKPYGSAIFNPCPVMLLIVKAQELVKISQTYRTTDHREYA